MMSLWKAIYLVMVAYISEFSSAYKPKMPPPYQAGIASLFGYPGDRWASANLACAPGRKAGPREHVCAHRTLPCGTILFLENVRTGDRTWCAVMDHGPYGAWLEDDGEKVWVLKRRARDPGSWRGVVDLSPAVSTALSHNGFEKVRMWKFREVLKYWIHKPQRMTIAFNR